MKKLILNLILFLTVSSSLFAQQGINYKAIISDNGAVLQNQAIQVQFTILNSGVTNEYQETHSTTTDANGIIIVNIGEGTVVSGLFNSIGWHNSQFLKVEIDTGSGYVDFGTSEFKTVPYAIYAKNGNGAKILNDLADVKSDITSLYLGKESGSETGSNLDNTAVGNFSLRYNTSGRGNSAIGHAALNQNTDGDYNTAFGNTALNQNTSGFNNTTIGYQAGYNSLGNGNIFLGSNAGYNETGSNKLYIENSNSSTPLIGGDFSTDEVTVNGSIAIVDGTEGLDKVLTSDANGKATWQTPVTGATQINDLSDAIFNDTDFNLFLGTAGNSTNTGSYNIGLGNAALRNVTTGRYNNSIGRGGLFSLTTGEGNTALGELSQFENTIGNYNVSIGYATLYTNITGIENLALGYYAGYNSTGNGNIFLGSNAGYNESGNNKLYIENSNSSTPLIGGDFSTDEVTINGSLQITGDIKGNVTATHSGTADMKAYLFGSVGLDGAVFATSSSDGFTSSKVATGHYIISSAGLGTYTVTATMRYGFIGFITVEKFGTDFRVKTYNTSGVAEDRGFDFIVFKR